MQGNLINIFYLIAILISESEYSSQIHFFSFALQLGLSNKISKRVSYILCVNVFQVNMLVAINGLGHQQLAWKVACHLLYSVKTNHFVGLL